MFGVRLSKMGSASKLGLIAKAIGILRKYGADAHVYLPGIGTVSGLTAGNYLDSAGTTAASVDNPVGLSLDALQAMTLGSDIAVNGGFDTDTSWTKAANWSIAGGVATSNGGTGFLQANTPPLTAGKTYSVTVSIKRYVSGAIYYPYSGAGGVAAPSAIGTFTSVHLATSSNLYVYSLAFNGDIDDVIVQEIPGIHATQATTANKPLVRRGMYNQVLHSNNISAWSTTVAGTITNGQTDPFGGTNAQLFSGANKNCYMVGPNAGAVAAGTPVTHAIYCYSAVAGTITIGSATGSPQTLISVAAGWGVYVFSWTAAANDGPVIVLNGTLTSITIYNQGFFKGTWTAAQILAEGGIPTTTATAASNPSAGKYWWSFDGSNDSLSLSAPLFQMSDDHCVIAGFNAAAVDKYVFSQNNTAALTLVASIRINYAGAPNALWQDDTAALVNIASSTSCIGANTVATAVKIGNAKRLRVNGVQQGATNNTVLGATTLNNYAIGSYTTGGYFQGSIYPIIAIKGTLSDSDLLVLERFVGQLSGVTGI